MFMVAELATNLRVLLEADWLADRRTCTAQHGFGFSGLYRAYILELEAAGLGFRVSNLITSFEQ